MNEFDNKDIFQLLFVKKLSIFNINIYNFLIKMSLFFNIFSNS